MRAKEFIHEADPRRQRISEIITEVFGSEPPETQWSQQQLGGNPRDYTTQARWQDPTGKEVITFFAPNANQPGEVDVMFARDGSVKRTGTGQGKQSQVFGGVMHNINDYLKMNPNVNAITFSAGGDPGRAELYQKMVNRLAPQFGLEQVPRTGKPGERFPLNLIPTVSQSKDIRRTPTNLMNPDAGSDIVATKVASARTPNTINTVGKSFSSNPYEPTTVKSVQKIDPNLNQKQSFQLRRIQPSGGGGGGGGLPAGGSSAPIRGPSMGSTTGNVLRQMNPFKLN